MSSYEDRMAEKYNFLKKDESENNVQKEEVSSEDKITNDVVPDENQEKDSLLVPLDAWNTVLAEFPDMTHPARQFVQRNKALLLARLRDRAQAAGATDPDALADDLAFLIEGAYTPSQTFGPAAPRLIKSLPRTARVFPDVAIPPHKPD
mgnify:CR=1 FL=1